MSSESATAAEEPWGRVDDDGTVYVREGETWRSVGQYPDGTPEEALAYFQRKYTDLSSELTLIEQRHRSGGASASDLLKALRSFTGKLKDAAAVGDLAALRARLEPIEQALAEAREQEAESNREAVAEALRARTSLVEQAEALAARDPKTVQWKQASADLAAIFATWREQQQRGPRIPKKDADELWKRFRSARGTVERNRRAFFSELDSEHKAVRATKNQLIERAEALQTKGEDAIPAYRSLLDEWKRAGRAGKKADDQLWARFQAAGDALYAARAEREATEAVESEPKIAEKEALLQEASSIADERNLKTARQRLTTIQRSWDEIGRVVPRERDRALDDRLRKIEQALRTREDAEWKRNNPETKARAGSMAKQLESQIELLEQQIDTAKSVGDDAAAKRLHDELETKRSWLAVIDR